MLKRLVVVGLLGAGAWWYWHKHDAPDFDPAKVGSFTAPAESETDAAFRDHRSGVMVTMDGTVDRVLADDTQGSPHQRFIVRLASGQTVLVAHNLALSRRVEALKPDARILIHGEYEWNARGGVVHWTHADPVRKHEAGWIVYDGKRYE